MILGTLPRSMVEMGNTARTVLALPPQQVILHREDFT
jgi:hypothetical protein